MGIFVNLKNFITMAKAKVVAPEEVPVEEVLPIEEAPIEEAPKDTSGWNDPDPGVKTRGYRTSANTNN